MSERPDDFIVVHPTTRLTEAEAEAFRAGALAGLQKGAARERRAIVAWLRSGDVCPSPPAAALVLAELIERGEHLGSDDDRPL